MLSHVAIFYFVCANVFNIALILLLGIVDNFNELKYLETVKVCIVFCRISLYFRCSEN